MAGQLKRDNPDIHENLTLIRALRDSNLPKFLANDAILFQVQTNFRQTDKTIKCQSLYGRKKLSSSNLTNSQGLQKD